MQFTKMHGAGNDYVYIDCFSQPVPNQLEQLAKRISDRHTGIGGDGLILILPSEVADARMQMFNADGTESEMCGNGIRCVAKYLHDHGICKKHRIMIETGAGILALEVAENNGKVHEIAVDMGEPILDPQKIPTTFVANPVVNQKLKIEDREFDVNCVSMGNPHCVIFVDSISDDLVLGCGPLIEMDARFPNRINVEFVEVVSPAEVRQRTWERGSGETLACGTGASAVCVAGVLSGRTERQITNHLLGGTLRLRWNENDNHVIMTGPAEEVFTGIWPLN